MLGSYHIRLEKEQHVFSAAHFITFQGNICERLHGHNYGVAVEVYGPLDENGYVVDFIAARDTLSVIVQTLDHRMLLPDSHPLIRVTSGETEIMVTFEERRWIFPKDDCVILPVANTTAELLAAYIGRRFLEELRQRFNFVPEKIVIEVDENHAQRGICSLTGIQ